MKTALEVGAVVLIILVGTTLESDNHTNLEFYIALLVIDLLWLFAITYGKKDGSGND